LEFIRGLYLQRIKTPHNVKNTPGLAFVKRDVIEPAAKIHVIEPCNPRIVRRNPARHTNAPITMPSTVPRK
jgi:hypothetical protein